MQRPRAWQATVCAALACVALAACGEKSEPEVSDPPSTTATVPATTTTATSPGHADRAGQGQAPPRSQGKPHGPAESGAADPRLTAAEREAEATVRRYVGAIDDRDGRAVCAVLAPGAAAELDPPVRRGDVCASIGASIGYRDPRGLPVWQRAEVAGIRSVEVDGATAKVVATTVTRFADRGERSVEDDIVYLVRSGERWLVTKPSSTLYRSIGVADVPPSVLAPPR